MTFLASNEREQRQLVQGAGMGPGTFEIGGPAAFEGFGTATGLGIGRGLATTGGFLLEVARKSPTYRMQEGLSELFGQGEQFRENERLQDEAVRGAIDYYRPDPQTTGFAGQISYGAGAVLLPAIIGSAVAGPAGGAILAGGAVGTGTFADLTGEGVDRDTALRAAGIDAFATGVGVLAPASMGAKLLTKVATGAGVNVALGAGQRYAMGEYLRGAGYGDIAARYDALDATAVATDMVLGAAFGVLPNGARPPQQAVDAAMVSRAAIHAEVDTAPGIPANMQTRAAHVKALDTATEQLLGGQQVAVADGMAGARFIPKPGQGSTAEARALAQALKETNFAGLADEVAALSRELETRGLVDDSAPLIDVNAAMASLEQAGARVGRLDGVKVGEEYVPVRWALMEAEQVAPTTRVSENQLRDRTRAASELQVNEIAAKLDPRLLLTETPTMDVGAPTMTADGRVVAGNGRALAIRKAYGMDTGAGYRTALAEAAERFGMTRAEVEGMQQPVLVRVLQQNVDIERAAILSNEGGAMRMSGLEQARVDAGRLPQLSGVDLPDGADLSAASLRDVVRGWAAQFPASQRAALFDAAGELSQEGMTRLRNALLFRAYGDSTTLQRLVESTDPGARNVANALVRVAPKVAEVKDSIERGELHQLDLSDEIVRMADLYDSIRNRGQTVEGWMAQLDMFNPGESPATLALLRFVGANSRSGRAMADAMVGYYDRVVAAGNPGQGDMLGGGAPTKEQLLASAIAEAAPAKAADIVQDTLFRPTKPEMPVRADEDIKAAELDAANFGLAPPPRTIPDGDPLLEGRAEDMSPERVAMRTELVEQRFAGKAPATGRPVAFVMGGGGASGKGTILRRLREMGQVGDEFVTLDPDSFKVGDKAEGWGGIPEYWDIVGRGDARAAGVVHKESSLIYKQALARAVGGKFNVVLDRTLGSPATALKELQDLKAAGYEIRLIGITVKPETAIKRAVKRAGGKEMRYVPLRDLLAAHKGFAQGFDTYAALADSAVLFDNDVAQGADAKPLAVKGEDGALRVVDERGYNEFAQKGYLNENAETIRQLRESTELGRVPGEPGDTGRGASQGGQGNRAPAGAERTGRAGGVPSEGLTPELQVVTERPGMTVITESGSAAPAADTLIAADVAVARAGNDALGFEAAINCYLRSSA